MKSSILFAFLILILLITVCIQISYIEIIDKFPLSDEFIQINMYQNNRTVNFLRDVESIRIYDTYKQLTIDELQIMFNNDYHTLAQKFLQEEENKLNKTLTGNADNKVIYLTLSGPMITGYYFNLGGEYVAKIDGKVYVWQPIDTSMLVGNLVDLTNNMNKMNRGELVYIEGWILEKARTGTSNVINGNYFKNTRPKESDIMKYVKKDDTFTYKRKSPANTEVKIGNKTVKFLGYRQDAVAVNSNKCWNGICGMDLVNGRIFDEPSNIQQATLPGSVYSSKNAKKRHIRDGNYNYYWIDKIYEKYLEESVNRLDSDVKCFGLGGKGGQVYWSKDQDRCNRITHIAEEPSTGWPIRNRFNFYIMRADNTGINYEANANLTGDEALLRRLKTRRENNKILALKDDINMKYKIYELYKK